MCLETGDSGADGTHLYPDDPLALGHRYTGPYVTLQPDLAFVLEDDEGVCGYTLAALDTHAFYERMTAEWLPPLQAKHRTFVVLLVFCNRTQPRAHTCN